MKKCINYYNFRKCNLDNLEKFYNNLDENIRKVLLGEAIANFLLSEYCMDEELIEVMELLFPVTTRTKYIINSNSLVGGDF